MNELQFADDVLARLRAQGGPYHERGFLFVLGTIEYLQSRLEARRHVTGAELAWACRDFAREQFGLLAPHVLGHWGITRTEDFGRRSTSMRCVSVPPDTIAKPRATRASASALALSTTWRA